MKNKRKHKIKAIIDLSILLSVVVVINLLSTGYYKKFDLTKEKRYTLSETSVKLAESVDDYIYFKVYLHGDLSSKFKLLKNAVSDVLTEFRELSGKNIEIEFVDPFEGKENKEKNDLLQAFEQKGLRPYDDVDDASIESQTRNLIVPGAEVFYGSGKSFVLYFLKTELGMANEENINQSIENLEYEIAHAIRKCKADQNKKIGILTGHGELDPLEMYDLTKELSTFYRVDELNIDLRNEENIKIYESKLQDNEEDAKIILAGLQNRINQYDAVVIAKPTIDLSKEEAFLIDQYILKGGKTIWMLDALNAEMDSMRTGRMICTDYPLENIRELLFHYGVRINLDLLQDFRCNDIKLRDPYSANAFRNFPWVYFPVFTSDSKLKKHPISRNMEGVWGRFCGTMTLLKKDNITATPLLVSSDKTKVSNSPALVEFSIIDKLRKQDPAFFASYNGGHQVVAALIEGNFNSSFSRRNVRSEIPFIDKGKSSMIVISDGDMARNHVSSDGGYLELGKDHITGRYFANKKFLLNSFDFMLDDLGLIEIRSKEIILRLLDKDKIKEELGFWQLVNVGMPIFILLLFASVNTFIRKRKYAK
jgi:gliding-associated putative ABC transporter substrate-binding component GldG